MRLTIIPLTALLILAGCHGPKEKAGEAQDKAEAAASGTPYAGNGPNQRLGAAEDKADHTAAETRDAQVDTLKKQARAIRSDADAQADKLEQQAKAIRKDAKTRADTLDAQAEQIKVH